MRSFDRAQQPAEWRRAQLSVRAISAIGVLAAIGCGALLVGVVGGMDGRPMVLRYGASFGCLVLLITVFGVLTIRQGSGDPVRSTSAESGSTTEVRQSRLRWVVLVAITVCCTILTIGPAVEIYFNAPVSGVPGAPVIFGSLGLLFASFLFLVVLRLVRPGAVLLTPEGVRHRGWSFESYLPWDSVAGVKPAYNGHRIVLLIGFANAHWTRRYTTPIWRIDKLPPVPMIELDCRKFAMDDVLLLHFVSFYAHNPAMRAELGTAAAQARFEARDFA